MIEFSNTCLAEDRIGQNFCKIMKCVENFALSYIFPTCMNFEFLSSGGLKYIEVA